MDPALESYALQESFEKSDDFTQKWNIWSQNKVGNLSIYYIDDIDGD